MENLDNMDNVEYTEARIKKLGYVVLSGTFLEVVISAKRIALVKELKCIKMLVNPTHVDVDVDLELLRILDEPHLKIASKLADSIFELVETYGLVHLLSAEEVENDKWATEHGWRFFWRLMFFRQHHRRLDRYVNFTRVLRSAQRVIYELLKLMITGATRMEDRTYRTNYSPGRVKALLLGITDPMLLSLAGLITQVRDSEAESRVLTARF
ncbi:hypothetical protein [Pedobacter nyackensis]|uniref:hypothetical protein n=1 Tax=Pedobacter nyackensis TaxID=475255 RepID=UPI00292DA393|nr:hypothetical protein [Pedobacter nyackensis]